MPKITVEIFDRNDSIELDTDTRCIPFVWTFGRGASKVRDHFEHIHIDDGGALVVSQRHIQVKYDETEGWLLRDWDAVKGKPSSNGISRHNEYHSLVPRVWHPVTHGDRFLFNLQPSLWIQFNQSKTTVKIIRDDEPTRNLTIEAQSETETEDKNAEGKLDSLIDGKIDTPIELAAHVFDGLMKASPIKFLLILIATIAVIILIWLIKN